MAVYFNIFITAIAFMIFGVRNIEAQNNVLKVQIDYQSKHPKVNCIVKYVRLNLKHPESNSLAAYQSSTLCEFDAEKIWAGTPGSRLHGLYLLGYTELDSFSISDLHYKANEVLDSLQFKYPKITKQPVPKNPKKIWKQMKKSGFLDKLNTNLRDPSYYDMFDSIWIMRFFRDSHPEFFKEKIVKVVKYTDEQKELNDLYNDYLSVSGRGCRIFMDSKGYNPFLYEVDAAKHPKEYGHIIIWECQVNDMRQFEVAINDAYDIIIFWATYSNGKESPYYIWSGDSDEFHLRIDDVYSGQKIDPIPLFLQN